MIKLIKQWYQGKEYNISTSELLVFPGIRYKRHWTSQVAHIIVDFYLKEWKWLLPFIVGFSALLLKIF